MTVQEAREFFETTDFSQETKQKIKAILEDKTILDEETVIEIKEIMQEELDKDFEAAGITDEDPDIQKIEEGYSKEIDNIEKEMDEDSKSVEEEMNDLEELRKGLVKASEEAEIEQIKQSI